MKNLNGCRGCWRTLLSDRTAHGEDGRLQNRNGEIVSPLRLFCRECQHVDGAALCGGRKRAHACSKPARREFTSEMAKNETNENLPKSIVLYNPNTPQRYPPYNESQFVLGRRRLRIIVGRSTRPIIYPTRQERRFQRNRDSRRVKRHRRRYTCRYPDLL